MLNKDDDDKIVIKHSGAVQISNTISLFQRRAWNVLLANAYDRLLKQDTFEVSISELADVLSFDSKNLKYLKDNIKELIGCVVEWDMLAKTGDWEGYGLLSSAKIINGNILQYSFDSKLKKKLYHPTTYAKISLGMQKRFTSKYTLALYELCVNFFIVKYGKGETPWISIDDYRKLMDVDKENRYEQFKDLNRYIIKTPIDEINKKSDLYVDTAYQRIERKVVAIKFKISLSPNSGNLLKKLDLVKEVTRQGELPLPESDKTLAVRQRMAEYGLSQNQVEDLLREKGYDVQLITDALDYVDIKIRADKIETTVPGYTFKVIQNFNPGKSLKEKLIEGEKKAKEELDVVAQEQAKLNLRIEREYVEYRRKMTEDFLESINEETKNNLMKSFETKLDVYELKMYKENGLERPAIMTQFNQYVSDNFLKDKILSKKQFADQYQLE